MRVTVTSEGQDHHDSDAEEGGGGTPIEGLQDTIQVEVTHAASGASRVLDFHTVPGDPGHYVADLTPTVPGVYEFRVFGSIKGVEVDETFVSMGAGGVFDDVLASSALHFPEQLPEIRELESAVRGALTAAQQAQDAALAAEQQAQDASLAAESRSEGVGPLVVVALALGALGSGSGLLALYLSARRR